tara:strand:+ start:20 stop:229 length:210 start_codon:yes stop_codon:yes gene_type:complete
MGAMLLCPGFRPPGGGRRAAAFSMQSYASVAVNPQVIRKRWGRIMKIAGAVPTPSLLQGSIALAVHGTR